MSALPFVLILAQIAVADAGPVRFKVDTATGATRTGVLDSFSAAGAVALSEPTSAVLAGDVLGLRRAGRPLPAWPRSAQVVFPNGDRVACSLGGGEGARVVVRPTFAAAGETWAIPLAALSALWVVPPPADTPPDPARYPWRPAGRRGDVFLLTNGDVVEGTVEAVSPDGAALQLAAERGLPARYVPTATVAAVAFDPSLARVRKPKGPYYRVTTITGSRFGSTALTSDGATFAGTTLFGAKFRLPVGDVAAVDVLQGKAVYLSDLKPKRAASEGYVGVEWPWAADRTVKGLPLRLPGPDGGWFDKGLGTHPRTTLVYDLGGKYRRFEALVGLDAATGRRGVVTARILVDGKPAAVPGLAELTSAASPVPVRVDLTGAKQLTLEVDFGPAGGVDADVDWAAARFVE